MLAEYYIKVEKKSKQAADIIESISIEFQKEKQIDFEILNAQLARCFGHNNNSLLILNKLLNSTTLSNVEKVKVRTLISRNQIDLKDYIMAEAVLKENVNCIDSIYYRALIKFENNRLNDSMNLLQEALKIDKLNLRCLRLMGILKFKVLSLNESQNYFQVYFRECPGDKVALNYYSELLILQKRYSEAILILEKSRVFDPNQGQPLYLLGLCQFEMKDYKLAFITLKDSLNLEVQHQTVYLLGKTYEQLGELQSAKLQYLESSKMEPNNDKYLFSVGEMVEQESGEDSLIKARDIFRQVIILNPKHNPALLRLGKFYMGVADKKNHSVALGYFEKVLDTEPENIEAIRQMITIIGHTKDFDNLKKFQLKFNKGITNNSSLLTQICDLHFSDDNRPKKWTIVAPYLIQIIELEKVSPSKNQMHSRIAKLRLSQYHFIKNEFTKSIFQLKDACKGISFDFFSTEQKQLIIYQRGIIHLNANELHKAMRSFQQYLKVSPHSPNVVAFVAYIHLLWQSPRFPKILSYAQNIDPKSDLCFSMKVSILLETKPDSEEHNKQILTEINKILFTWKKEYPDSPHFFLRSGQVSLSRKNFQQALNAFTQCKDKAGADLLNLQQVPFSQSEMMQSKLGQIKAHIGLNEIKFVLKDFETIMKDFMNENEVLNFYAEFLFQQGDLTSAMHFSKRSIERDQGFGYNYYIIGFSCLKKEQYDSAVPYLKKCRMLSPETKNIDQLLLQAYEGCGMFSEALQLALPLLSFNTSDPKILLQCVNLLMSMGRYDEANILFQRWKQTHNDMLDISTSILFAYLKKRQNNVTEAIHLLEYCLQDDPLNESVMFSLGSFLHQTNQFEKEINIYLNFLTVFKEQKDQLIKDPNQLIELECRVMNNLGNVYLKQGQFSQAALSFGLATKSSENKVQYSMNQCIALIAIKKFQEAQEILEAQMKHKGYSIAPLFMFGYIMSLKKETNQAIKWYQKCLKMDYQFAPAALNLSIIYRKIGNSAEAVSILRQQVEMNPNIIQITYQLALTHINANQLSSATALLIEMLAKYESCVAPSNRFISETLISIFPNLIESSFPSFATAESKNQFSDFIISYQEKGMKVPSRVMLNLLLARVYRRQNRIDNEIKHYENILRTDEQNPDFIFGYGSALQVAGKYKQALIQYEQSLELNPSKKPMILLAMSTVYHHYGDINKEVKLLNQCINLNPNLFQVYDNLGSAYTKQKRYDEAYQAYLKSIKIAPNRADAHYNLALNFMQTKQIDAAISSLKHCLELAPNHLLGNFNLGILYSITNSVDLAIICFKRCSEINPYDPKQYLDKLDSLYKRQILNNLS